ncbi:MAG TPA: Hpt domain-containing protein, partial [Candidatus Eisenbacteria bacterium]
LAGGCAMLGARHLAASCHGVQGCIEAGDLAGARAALQAVDRNYEALEHTFEELSLKRAA